MKAMLLAAGEGARLRPLTDTAPKPMLPVGGRPVLEHTIHLLGRQGVREAVINLHHCPDVIRKHFGDGMQYGMHLEYSYEPELLGTAGAVKRLAAFFRDGPFFLVYGDNLTTCNLGRLAEYHRERGGIATMALYWREDVASSGVVELQPDGRITQFLEKPDPAMAPSYWVNAGVLVLEPAILDYIPADRPSDFGHDILPQVLVGGQEIFGYTMSGGEGLWWIDTVEDYQRVSDLWKGGFPS